MTDEIEDVHVTIDQDDIDEMRENGWIERKGVAFCQTSSRHLDIDEDNFKRVVTLNPGTLYKRGDARWNITSPFEDEDRFTDVYVAAEYDRPPIERVIESELEYMKEAQCSRDNWRDEWFLGNIHQLKNLQGWFDDE
jgi:hypothetical protein